MIGYLKGVVQAKTADGAVILVEGGVGYSVIDPSLRACETGDVVERYIWHVVDSSNNQQLYGFNFQAESELAQTLATAPRIGPVVASRLLHIHGLTVARMIIDQDAHGLADGCRGLSPKSATGLIQAVRDRVAQLDIHPPQPGYVREAQARARATLKALGFSGTYLDVLLQAPPDLSAEELVTWFMRREDES